jgi:hypothetical protein
MDVFFFIGVVSCIIFIIVVLLLKLVVIIAATFLIVGTQIFGSTFLTTRKCTAKVVSIMVIVLALATLLSFFPVKPSLLYPCVLEISLNGGWLESSRVRLITSHEPPDSLFFLQLLSVKSLHLAHTSLLFLLVLLIKLFELLRVFLQSSEELHAVRGPLLLYLGHEHENFWEIFAHQLKLSISGFDIVI